MGRANYFFLSFFKKAYEYGRDFSTPFLVIYAYSFFFYFIPHLSLVFHSFFISFICLYFILFYINLSFLTFFSNISPLLIMIVLQCFIGLTSMLAIFFFFKSCFKSFIEKIKSYKLIINNYM